LLALYSRRGLCFKKALGLKPDNRYNLFDKHGDLDYSVAIKSLAVGGGLGVWGDMVLKLLYATFVWHTCVYFSLNGALSGS
jgi:hypothetical protein